MEKRVVRQRRGREAPQQALRLHQGRPRGAAGRRPLYMTALNVMGQTRRLAAVDVPDRRRQADRRRHLLAAARTRRSTARRSRGFKSHPQGHPGRLREEAEELEEQADKLAKATADAAGRPGARRRARRARPRPGRPASADGLREDFDPVYGGFGNAEPQVPRPKFPMPPSLRLPPGPGERARSRRSWTRWSPRRSTRWRMGGIYDHLGGGFHRYSTERTWTVPHFEKMLYDNAQLLEVYARRLPRDEEAALRAASCGRRSASSAREMTSPEGGVLLGPRRRQRGRGGQVLRLDRRRRLDAVLTGQGRRRSLFSSVYGVDDGPNFEEKYHILRLPTTARRSWPREAKTDRGEARRAAGAAAAEAVRRARQAAAAVPRHESADGLERPDDRRPGARPARRSTTSRPSRARRKAADFVLKTLRNKDGRLLRTYGAAPGEKPAARLNAYLDDYAFLVHGLLTLHDVDRREALAGRGEAR